MTLEINIRYQWAIRVVEKFLKIIFCSKISLVKVKLFFIFLKSPSLSKLFKYLSAILNTKAGYNIASLSHVLYSLRNENLSHCRFGSKLSCCHLSYWQAKGQREQEKREVYILLFISKETTDIGEKREKEVNPLCSGITNGLI